MSIPLQIAANAVTAKILTKDPEVKHVLSALLSYEVDGAEYSKSFKARHWDGRSSFFAYAQGSFPSGFVHQVYGELTRKGYAVQIIQKRPPAPIGPEAPVVDAFGEDPRYDFQDQAVRQVLRHGRGIVQVATGGGKSRIAKKIVARIRRPTLFLTTRQILMYQMAKGFAEAGFNCGILGDGEWRPVMGVNCGMVQTLVARLKEPEPDDLSPEAMNQRLIRARTIKLLAIFEVVIGEEAHEAGGNTYFEILQHCRQAYYRVALTATPFMKPDAESNMRLQAAFGSIIMQVSEKLLIDRGILARPYFKFVDTAAPAGLRPTTGWPAARTIGIVENEGRNRMIVYEAVRAARYGLPILVLVQQTAHGKVLAEMLRAAGLRSTFLWGKHEQNERTATLAALKSGKLQVVVASTILDVGVDVPALGMVIIAGGGKAEVGQRQRIGRGLREKKNGTPNVAFIVDFEDKGNSHLRTHARTRRKIIEQTPGFVENILPPGRDFDFEALGLKAAA